MSPERRKSMAKGWTFPGYARIMNVGHSLWQERVYLNPTKIILKWLKNQGLQN